MTKNLYVPAVFALIVSVAAGCGVNSVTKEQLGAVKTGDVLVYRFQKDGKSWFYADKITRIEGDTIYYNPSSKEGTSGNDERIKTFDTKRELSIKNDELFKFDTEQGDDRKVIIWIQ
ncbi:MAG: hypothetical protein ABI791_08755 [Acidobacteriota bacterium]